MAFIPQSGSVVAFQSDPTKLVGTVSIIGSPTQIAGSVLAVNMPSPSMIAYQAAGSIMAVSGSFSSTPQSSIIATQIAGSILAVNMPSPSIIAYQAAGSVLAVSGSFSANPQSSIIALQLAGSIMAVSATVNTGNSSVQVLNSVAAGVIYNPSVLGLMFVDGTAVNQSAGNLMVNVGNLAIGTFGNSDGTNPAITSGLDFAENLIYNVTDNKWDRWLGTSSVGGVMTTAKSSVITVSQGSIAAALMNSSVTTLQGTNPWLVNVPTPSYISYQAAGSVLAVSGSFTANPQSSIIATQIAGSILAVNFPSPSIIAIQAAGSIMAVSGTFTASPQASINALQLAGSVLAIRTDNASVVAVLSNSSVATLQGTNPWVISNPSVTAFMGGAWSVSILGTYLEKNAVTASVIGVPTLFKIDETNSVLSAVSPQSPFPIRGSVATLQGTNPWIVNVPTPSYLSIQPAGSVLNANISGSIAAAVTNFSASVAANINVISASIITNQGTNPWLTQILGGSVLGTYTENSVATASVIGHALLFKKDETNSILSAVSPQHPLPIQGSITTLQGTNPWLVNVPTPSYISYQLAGSVMAVSATVNTGNSSVQLLAGVNAIGSVATLQGTNPWIVQAISSVAVAINSTNTSIFTVISSGNTSVYGTVSVLGTVPVTQSTTPWIIGSILGTFAEDSPSTDGDKGLFIFGVRNDTMASLVSTDKDYGALTTDAQGRLVTKPFIPNDGTLIEYASSVVSTSVTLIQASAIGKRNYVTDFYLANSGSVATIVQLRDGSTSILGTTIAPAGGGSNGQGFNLPIRTAVGQDLVFTGFTASSVLYINVRGYQGQ